MPYRPFTRRRFCLIIKKPNMLHHYAGTVLILIGLSLIGIGVIIGLIV